MRFLLIIGLLITGLSQVAAKSKQEAAVDALFAEWDKNDTPGASLGVFKDGKVLYAKGYGMANLEYDIANKPDSVFRIGSTSKQFTAASIMLLVQQGKLSLDDTLYSFFPEFPDYAKQITVGNLVHHTSGIRDYLMLSHLKGLDEEDYYEDKDIMHWLTNQQGLSFEPGSAFLYSNSGYWLLGQIVKKVAGMDMAEFAEKNLFKPLGMNHSHFHNNHKQIVKKRASGYAPTKDDGYEISMTTLNMIGDGGVFTTVNDLKKWDDAFYQSKVLNPAFWQAMTQQGKLNDGEETDYAGGLLIGEHKGLKTISHGGAFVGFRAEMLRFPEQRFSVVILANRADARPSSLARKVADVYLAQDVKAEPEKPVKVEKTAENAEPNTANNIPQAPLDHLIGQYEVEAGIHIKISVVADKQLHAKQLWNNKEYDLLPVPEQANTYSIANDPSITFVFQAFKDQQSTEIKLTQGGRPSVWRRVAGASENIDLSQFVGDYHSPELEMVYQLRMQDDALTVKIADKKPLVVNATGPDQLVYRGAICDFIRDAGKITGFTLSAGRAKNLKFTKR